MAKKRRSKSRRRSGTGQLITIRRMKGVGSLRRPSSFAGSAVPPLVGGGVTGLAMLATRYWAKPSESETGAALFRHAPAVGMGAGALSSVSLYWLGGAPAMISSMVSTLLVGGAGYLHDMLLKERRGEFDLAMSTANGAGNGNGDTSGLGVIVPERIAGANGGTGAIMFQPTSQVDPYKRYGVSGLGYNDQFGQTVNLSGVNPSVFGQTRMG